MESIDEANYATLNFEVETKTKSFVCPAIKILFLCS